MGYDITAFYDHKRRNIEDLTASKARGDRPFDPDSRSVWLVTTKQAEASFGGRAGVATMMSVDKAGEALADLFGAWRLSTIEDTLEGGAIWESHRLQRENLALRNVEVANSGDGNSKNPRRTEVPLPRHLKEVA